MIVNSVATSANLMGLGDLAGGKAINKGATRSPCSRIPPTPVGQGPGARGRRKILKKQIPAANAKDGYYYAGMASAISLVNVLKRAGAEPLARLVDEGRAHAEPAEAPATDPRDRSEDVADGRLPHRAGGAAALGERQGLGHGHWSMFGPLRTAKS